jgi:hypothetical protein
VKTGDVLQRLPQLRRDRRQVISVWFHRYSNSRAPGQSDPGGRQEHPGVVRNVSR